MIRRGLAAAMALTTLSGLLGAPAGARGCAGGPSVESFEVLTEWSRETYPPGATVEVDITVLRPGPKDPFGLGVPWDPPHQEPVEGAKVVTSFTVGFPPVWGGGYTDADGKLHLAIPLRPDIRGPVHGLTRAWIIYNEQGPDCTQVEEWGRKPENPAFVVREG